MTREQWIATAVQWMRAEQSAIKMRGDGRMLASVADEYRYEAIDALVRDAPLGEAKA